MKLVSATMSSHDVAGWFLRLRAPSILKVKQSLKQVCAHRCLVKVGLRRGGSLVVAGEREIDDDDA